MNQFRQLAAIMFTDIVGYTALMQEDEEKAFRVLHQNRQLQHPLIERFNGKWIKEFGDGVLASFIAVTDAIQCAISIQQACQYLPDFNLRIGIHLGEVIFEDNDAFGDGVNIASRIQALAPAGGVWITGAVFDNISNKKGFQSRFIKTETLKNVKEPIRIYEIDVDHASILITNLSNTTLPPANKIFEKSIAVLPFVNMSNDSGQEYFSDGIAEEILNSLGHLKDLKVAGRTSSFQFKGLTADLRQIGEKLGVSNILEGSIRKQGNRLRVTAQLVSVEDGYNIWSERYDRELDDIFAIQDEIAIAITEKLKVTLLDKDRERITRSFTQNADAYELYLKGRFFVSRRGAAILSGMQYFLKAMEIDPDFALPHVGYSDANLLLASYGLAPPGVVLPKAKQSAERAIALDPSLCEPYCSLGFYYTCYEWNWLEAKKNFLKSIELNPRYADAHFRYGWNFLSWVEGRFDEAKIQGEMAVKLEPLNSICYGAYSLILHTAGRFSEALTICQSGIELDANSFLCRVNEGSIYMALKEYTKAIVSCKIAIEISNRHHFAVNGLIWIYCLNNNFEEARVLMNELQERSSKEYIAYTFFGISAAYLDEIDTAFEYLEKAYEDRDPTLLTIKYESWVPEKLRADPRFQKLINKIGYPG